MSLLEETKLLLRNLRIAPNKLRGQNFTVDPWIFDRLIGLSSVKEDDVVLDVGAGFGFLTEKLSERCQFVVAVESDKRLAQALRFKFRGSPKVKVIEGDVLKESIPAFNKVVSVPPYGISSHLLLWLFHQSFTCGALVFQREFGERLVADVGTDEYGWLSVFTSYYLEAELLEEVSRSAFFPQPDVDSVMVLLKPWQFRPFEVRNEAVFEKVVRFLFTQRNRKLRNALASFSKLSCQKSVKSFNTILENVSLDNLRVRELTPEDFGVLANACSQ